MDILQVTSRNITAASTDAELYAIAVNKAIPLGGGAVGDSIILYAHCLPTGLKNFGTKIGGTSSPTKSVQPSYFPIATMGGECAAVVESLDWADANLMEGYEFVQVNNTASATLYFVSGILNSTETEFNNPFSGTDFKKGVCWAGNYAVGINPF